MQELLGVVCSLYLCEFNVLPQISAGIGLELRVLQFYSVPRNVSVTCRNNIEALRTGTKLLGREGNGVYYYARCKFTVGRES